MYVLMIKISGIPQEGFFPTYFYYPSLFPNIYIEEIGEIMATKTETKRKKKTREERKNSKKAKEARKAPDNKCR